MATNLFPQQLSDANVVSTHPALALQTLGSKVTALLNGESGKRFVPTRIELFCNSATTAGDTPNGDAEIKVGMTGGGGSELCPAHLVKVTTTSGSATITLEGDFPPIAGNASIDVEVTKADTKGGGCAVAATVRVIGRQY